MRPTSLGICTRKFSIKQSSTATTLKPFRPLAATKSLRIIPSTNSQQGNKRSYASNMSGPPAHKMVHFPKMTTEFPAKSEEFRRVLWTGESSQLVEMTIPVGGDIGEEVHHVDQHLIFTKGMCKAIIEGEEKDVNAGDLVIVPQGSKHNFINTGKEPLVLFTVYAPAEHDPSSVHKTKEEGDRLEDEGKDEAPAWAKK